MTDNLNAKLSSMVGAYIELFNRQQFEWRVAHNLIGRELSEAELHNCIDDVCEYLRQKLLIEGKPLPEEWHQFLKGALIKKVMGPTKQLWTPGRKK